MRSETSMDSALIPKGVKRCPLGPFVIGIGIVGAVLLWGVFAMLLVWIKGLNQTNMNDNYGFALWIWADLAVIALGGGAFFTGLLRYIFGKDELKNIINYAVSDRVCLLQFRAADSRHGCRPTAAGLVYFLACQCPFHADGSGLLPDLLLRRADH